MKRLARPLVEFVGFGMILVKELFFLVEKFCEFGTIEFSHDVCMQVYKYTSDFISTFLRVYLFTCLLNIFLQRFPKYPQPIMNLLSCNIQRWNKAYSIIVCSAGEQQQAFFFCRMDHVFD